jgi:hypothetical protein
LLLHSYSIIYIIFDRNQKYKKKACEIGVLMLKKRDNYQQFSPKLLRNISIKKLELTERK